MNKNLIIKLFPRIHITLIGMNENDYRINGGIGFSINSPTLGCHFEPSDDININDSREINLTDDEKKRLFKTVNDIKYNNKFKNGMTCKIQGEILPHYGLGSTTSLYLACTEALYLMNNKSYNQGQLISLSKRGGTSGIGINTYFDGGFIFDVGIKNIDNKLMPSSSVQRMGKIPLIIHKTKLPDWNIGVCIPKYIKNKSEQEEVDFFKKHCPINKSHIENILYESVYGITSSIIEGNYDTFCQSINVIQSTKWKHLERSLYGNALLDLEKKIKYFGADCVGMSSLGPAIFFMAENIDDIIRNLSHEESSLKCYHAKFNNCGRMISGA
jgi:beta-ribofuranosylaminobenzene 5'-phosphate synthase